jgi:hypothetical protein
MPITKRGSAIDGEIDTSKLQSVLSHRLIAVVSLIALVTYLSPTGKFKVDLPHTKGILARVPHPLSRSIQLSGRASGGDPLTDDNAQLWFGTPPVNFTGMTFPYDDSMPLTDPWHGTVDFDTGSCGLLLPSPKCGLSCSGHKQYERRAIY